MAQNRRQHRGRVQLARSGKFKPRELIAGKSGEAGEQEQERNVAEQAIRIFRMAMSGPLLGRSGLESPGGVVRHVVHGSGVSPIAAHTRGKLSRGKNANNGTRGQRPSDLPTNPVDSMRSKAFTGKRRACESRTKEQGSAVGQMSVRNGRAGERWRDAQARERRRDGSSLESRGIANGGLCRRWRVC